MTTTRMQVYIGSLFRGEVNDLCEAYFSGSQPAFADSKSLVAWFVQRARLESDFDKRHVAYLAIDHIETRHGFSGFVSSPVVKEALESLLPSASA